ncbi:S24 family peptidase [Microbulbifer sp. OS29]|uniref:S24 family peptidase n=1 Tax=Microbulbifer okhotskensis TaxID=2926617 RepID=A0A9X2J8L5_9GAMM|nr:S24 family peptidase [Microbulbifer okhotskensis]MCO1336990.1 S24 family peptidase [Microbulbifer okhotskensis]
MQRVGIFDRDILIVDRSMTPVSGGVVVGALDGQLTCKILDLSGSDYCQLMVGRVIVNSGVQQA